RPFDRSLSRSQQRGRPGAGRPRWLIVLRSTAGRRDGRRGWRGHGRGRRRPVVRRGSGLLPTISRLAIELLVELIERALQGIESELGIERADRDISRLVERPDLSRP